MPRRRRDWAAGAAEALIVMVAIGLAFVAGIAGWAIGHAGRSKGTPTAQAAQTSTSGSQGALAIDPSVAAGAHDFVQFACAKCHGEQGRGGVSPDVPALTNAKDLTPGQLREIIDHGLGESANPKKPFMPVWGNVISTRQVDELVSYLRAGLPSVPTATPLPIPRNQGLAVEGAALYVSDGCINCHGPNGLGGVPNPQSEDKTIPPLSGVDFRGEFNTDAKIIDFIRTGSVLGRAPIVSMPHWGGIISDQELNALVAYLKTLK